MIDDRKRCGAPRIMAPGEVRWCDLDLHAATEHETTFRLARVSWRDGDEGTP